MRTIVIDGIKFTVEDPVADAYEKHLKAESATLADAAARADAAEKARDESQAKADHAASKLDETEKARADAADPAKFAKAVSERVALVTTATRVLGDKEKFDGLSDGDLRKKVIVKLDATAADKLKDASEDYVQARFDIATASLPTPSQQSLAAAAAATADPAGRVDDSDDSDEKVDSATAAIKDMKDRSRAAHLKPLEVTKHQPAG